MEIMFIRTILLFIISTVILRLMGKRQLGELEPFEVVITLVIAELAMTPMENVNDALIHGVMPIVTLYLTHTVTSYLALKSLRFRRFICGKETVLIDNGKILIENLKQNFVSMDEIMEQLRGKDIFDINEVDFAILEANGTISVMKKSMYKNPTNEDLDIKSNSKQKLPVTVILCGQIQKNVPVNKEHFIKFLDKKGYKNIKDIFYASISSDNVLFIQRYNSKSQIIQMGD